MNSRERVFTSLSWQDTDRLPCNLWLRPDMRQRLDAYLRQDHREAMDLDFRSISAPYRGEIKKGHGDVYYDMWGIGYKAFIDEVGSQYYDVVEHPLAEAKSVDEILAYPWPDPNAFDYAVLPALCDRYADRVIIGRVFGPGILNNLGKMRGWEQIMVDLGLQSDLFFEMVRKRVDFFSKVAQRYLKTCKGRIDIIHFAEDLGDQRGRRVSPHMFNAIWKPVLSKLFELGHHYGARTMLHSCGDTHEVMPELSDMGLDILDSMQPEPDGMEPAKIRALCYGKLAFNGLLSAQQTLIHGSEADCREEARYLIDVIGKGGGYFVCTSQDLQVQAPIENVLGAYEEALGITLIRNQ